MPYFFNLPCYYVWRPKFYQEKWNRIRTYGERREISLIPRAVLMTCLFMGGNIWRLYMMFGGSKEFK